MEINDIIRLMQAVSDNGLTSFKVEEGNMKLSIKKEKEVQQIVTVAGNNAAPQMTAPLITAQTAAVSAAGITGIDGNSISVTEAGSRLAADSAQAEGSIESDKVVSSPLVGTFYDAASPESDPFVKVGDTVKKGQTLGIIEAMKLMNEIESEFDGVIEAVLVGNEDVVEYGQTLFRIR